MLFHVLAVLVLSLPSSYKLADRARWNNARTKHEIGLWARRLRSAA